ncbi:ArsR/SmtB family transcription factor [Gymnodinialimonas hymeniacidonis]|uniref:ArsR/SmtB family transcription factor n=1 Tax=Gymnodinialimonas hymeniacidonis TaxID=3126508 RepID=UPI0034C6BA77
MTHDAQLDATFAALANPTRRAILARLATGPATVNDLAKPFEMSLPAISQHIRVLQKAGLIERTQTAQFRPCTLNAQPLQQIADWTEQYRHIWSARFDALDTALSNMKDHDND